MNLGCGEFVFNSVRFSIYIIFALNSSKKMTNKEQKITQSRLKSAYLSSVISTALVLFLLGIAGIFLINVRRVTSYFKDNISISVYLNDNLKESEVSQFRKKLDAAPYVRETEYTSKIEAAKKFEEQMGKDFSLFLDGNPLPESIEIWLIPSHTASDSMAAIQQHLESMPQVREVHYEKSVIDLVNSNISKISLVMGVFIVLLLFVSIVLINNTIRLSIYAKRIAIHTMKLVGASRSFIARPFITQSVVRGTISGLIAILMLYAAIYAVESEFKGIIEFAEMDIMLVLFVGILALGILINFISTYFAVRKYLRIDANELYY